MAREGRGATEAPVANVANVWTLARVDARVPVEVVQASESGSASATDILLLQTLRLEMQAQLFFG